MNPTVEQTVENWLKHDKTMFDECCDHPEVAWLAILELSKKDLSPDDSALLAAGPIETLLSKHGPNFIDRVEKEAKSNLKFKHLLGGVWQLGMTDRVWETVQAVREEVW